MKKVKTLKNVHTSNSKKGMGDYYGSGIKNPMGRMRDDYIMKPITGKKVKTPPKSLA